MPQTRSGIATRAAIPLVQILEAWCLLPVFATDGFLLACMPILKTVVVYGADPHAAVANEGAEAGPDADDEQYRAHWSSSVA